MQKLYRLFVLFSCAIAIMGTDRGEARETSKLDFSDITNPEFFPILPWDPYHGWAKEPIQNRTNGLESISACNFNMAGFVYPEDLRLCKKLGLGAIMFPKRFDSAKPLYREWRNMSDAQIDQLVKQWVKKAGSNPAVKGFFICDEPGLPEFKGLAKAVAAVEKYAPGKMAYINLFPDYATIGAPDMSQLGTPNYTEYLEKFVAEVHPQFLSYDNYMIQMSHDMKDRGQTASYFRNMLEVRRVAQEHHLPYLNIVASNQLRPGSMIPSPANLLLQAYTTLAAGYRGVTWYTYYAGGYKHAAISPADRKTPIWGWLSEVNRQVTTLAPIMCKLTSTGVFFSPPTPADGLPLLPGRIVQSVSSATPLMIGEFQDAKGHLYFMAVNLSLESSTRFNFELMDAKKVIKPVSSMDGLPMSFDKAEGYWLTAGEGALFQIGE